MNKPIHQHALYDEIIEGDGRVRRAPTMLGMAVMFTAFGIAVLVILYLSSVL